MSWEDSLLRTGLRAVRRREFDKIHDFLFGLLFESRIEFDSGDVDPTHVKSGTTSRVSISARNDNFHRVTDDPEECRIIAEESFKRLTFDLVHIRDVISCVIEIQFERDREEVWAETVTYHTGTFDDRDVLTISVTSPDPVTEATVCVKLREVKAKPRDKIIHLFGSDENNRVAKPHLGVPSPSHTLDAQHPPIFVISIDSLRYDRLDQFDPVIKAMGDDAIIPDEPRTQGVSTWPAHASLFTGVHPREHGCTCDTIGQQIDPSLTTMAELLEQHGYRNSACVSSGNLSPQIGFGRGFHRYQLQEIDWQRRVRDARTVFQTFEDWLSRDLRTGATRSAYFLHVFDTHYPYVPPYPTRNKSEYDFRWFDECTELASFRDYIELLIEDPLDVSPSFVRQMRQLYDACINFVVEVLRQFVATLKSRGLFDSSFIIILGDHGEDFFEHNFLFHHSLYDENIRPGMILKPPAEWSITVPDAVDYIDVLPTIAQEFGATDVLNQCAGVPFCQRTRDRPRITERKLNCYNVAVEVENEKVIFTYSGDEEPRSLVEKGLTYVESSEREDDYSRIERKNELTETEMALEQQVRDFVQNQSVNESQDDGQLSQGVVDRLAELGYK